MTYNETICKIGQALYGKNWIRPLARALGVNERQVRRWANNETAARHSALVAVVELAAAKKALLASLIE